MELTSIKISFFFLLGSMINDTEDDSPGFHCYVAKDL